MKKVMVVLGIVMILVGLTGCGKSEKDYVGRYVRELEPSDHQAGIKKSVIEIKITPGQIRPNYRWESRTEYESSLMSDFTSSGRWEIIKGKIVLHGSAVTIARETIKAELKGNKLLDHANNQVYVKQD